MNFLVKSLLAFNVEYFNDHGLVPSKKYRLTLQCNGYTIEVQGKNLDTPFKYDSYRVRTRH